MYWVFTLLELRVLRFCSLLRRYEIELPVRHRYEVRYCSGIWDSTDEVTWFYLLRYFD